MSQCLNILVVDDNRDCADCLALVLRTHGHNADIAYNGLAALEAARAGRPEVVLLDLAMPGLAGDELARQLRREPGMASVLLVCLSGHGSDEDRRRTQEAGFDHHLIKPVEAEEILAVLPTAGNGAAPVGSCGK